MQISRTQNQPNFKAKVPNVEQVIKQRPEAATILNNQVAQMEKIGPDATVTHQIYPSHKKSLYTLVTSITSGDGFSRTKKVKAEQLAETATSAYKKYLKLSAKNKPTQAKNCTYFQR